MPKKVRRPARCRLPSKVDLQAIAAEATYIGSNEHKMGRWWDGTGGARLGADGQASRPKKLLTTLCPLNTKEDRDKATHWIRQAIVRQQFLFVEGDQRFPKHVWYEDDSGAGWIGRCTNSVQGWYKDWPARRKEIEELSRRSKK